MCINRFLPVHLRADLTPFEISTHMNRVQDKVKAALDELAACMGSKGEKGDKGDAGTNGTNGTNGSNGANGTNGTNGPIIGTMFGGSFVTLDYGLTNPLWLGYGKDDTATYPIEYPIVDVVSLGATNVSLQVFVIQLGVTSGAVDVNLTINGSVANFFSIGIASGYTPHNISAPLSGASISLGVSLSAGPGFVSAISPHDLRWAATFT